MSSSARRASSSVEESAHVSTLVALRLRDIAIVSNTAVASDADTPFVLKLCTHSDAAHTQTAPPWVEVTVHPSYDTDQIGSDDTHTLDTRNQFSASRFSRTPLASLSSESVPVAVRRDAATIVWPGFEPALTLALPSLEELPHTAWRACLAGVTLTVTLWAHAACLTHVGGASSGGGGDEAIAVARCHLSLAELLFDTSPHQPVQAALHSVQRGLDDVLEAAVQFFVEAQEVQTLQVLMTAVALECPRPPACLEAAQKAATNALAQSTTTSLAHTDMVSTGTTAAAALASLVPATGSSLPALFALRLCVTDDHDDGDDDDDDMNSMSSPSLSPLCWADRQELSATPLFRWAALPLCLLPSQTLQTAEEDGVRCVVYARADPSAEGGVLRSSPLKAPATVCGTFRVPLTSLVPISLRRAAETRSGVSIVSAASSPLRSERGAVARLDVSTSSGAEQLLSNTTLCSHTFRTRVTWSSKQPALSMATVHGVIEVRSPFVYVQNGSTQYSYAPEMASAALQGPLVRLGMPTMGALRRDSPAASTLRLPSRSPQPTAPRGLTENSQLLETVVAQQDELMASITERIEAVRRQREAVLAFATQRRDDAATQRAAAASMTAALTSQLAEQRASVELLESELALVRAERQIRTQQQSRDVAERKLLVSRVDSEAQELETVRAQLLALKAQMTTQKCACERQADVTKARVEGLLMESVLNDSGVPQ